MDSTKINELAAQSFGPGVTFLSLGQGDLIDWFRVISTLERSGYSLQKISDIVGSPCGTLKGWKYGSRPRFEDALPLIKFWMDITGQNTEQLPRTKITLQAGENQ